MYAAPLFDVHAVTIPPMPKPVVVPLTEITPPERTPVIVIETRTGADGVPAFDGTDDADHRAPVNALPVKVYAVPFDRPATVHVIAAVKHVRPPGEETTW